MLSLLLTTLLPALLPVVIDGAKAGVSKLTDNVAAKPTNFQETMEWERFLLDKLKTMAELDKPSGNISQWVADLRASARYILCFLILATWTAVTVGNLPLDTAEYELLAQMATSSLFFMLGERVYMGLKKV
jgi:hypothetical protein